MWKLILNILIIKYIYFFNLISGFFEIIRKIDCDLRTDIYLGVTGFLTAIVIFVAEFVSNDEKSKLDKKVLISKTKIYDNVVLMIINMLALLIGQLITGIEYYVFQIMLNISIVISIFKTLKMFRIIIDLTLRDDLLAIERDQYIKDTFNAYDEKMENIKKVKEQSEYELEIALKANKFISYEKFPYFLDGYKAINSKYDGILKAIDLEKMEQILSNSQIENDEKIIYIVAVKGEYIPRKVLFYIKKEYEKYSENILSCFHIEKDEKHLDEDVNRIIKETINKIRNTDYYENIHSEIIGFFEDIISNNWKYVEELFYSQLYSLAQESVKLNKYNTIDILLEYVEDIALLLIRKNKIEEFERYYTLIYRLNINILDREGADRENITYRFTHFINSCIYRCGDDENKEKNYDLILSKVLRFIKILLRRKCPKAINIIFDNIAISRSYGLKKYNWLEDILFQFVIGILYALLYEYKALKETEFDGIKEILSELTYKFDFKFKYNTLDLIIKFNDFKNKESKIFSVYEDFSFGEPEDHKNKSFWSSKGINVNLVLCGLLRLYFTIPNDNIDKEKVNKEDKYFCDEMIGFLDNEKYKDLFEKFPRNLETNINEMKSFFENMKVVAIEKEEQYEMENELDKKKISEFKITLFDKIDEGNKLTSLFPNSKIESSTDVPELFLRPPFDLVSRNWFFKEIGGHKNLAENISEGINEAKTKTIIDYLKRNAKEAIDINSALNSLSNKNEAIIISGYKDCWNIFQSKDIYEYEGFNIPIVETSNEFTIITDKESLPILKYMSFDEKNMPKGERRGSTFIEITDCSDDKAVDEIIKNSKELQKEYESLEEMKKSLKKQCVVRVYHSVEIKECDNKDIYIIKEV